MEKLKKELIKKLKRNKFKISIIENINFGIQIKALYKNKKYTFRIFKSKKKGIHIDYSLINDKKIINMFKNNKKMELKNIINNTTYKYDKNEIGFGFYENKSKSMLILSSVYLHNKDILEKIDLNGISKTYDNRLLMSFYIYIITNTQYKLNIFESKRLEKLRDRFDNKIDFNNFYIQEIVKRQDYTFNKNNINTDEFIISETGLHTKISKIFSKTVYKLYRY